MRYPTLTVLIGALLLLCAQASARQAPALELAGTYRPGIDLSGYWISEKLDGVRARWDGRQLLSRRGNVFAAPDWFTEGFPPLALDGELWIGRGQFERVSGIVRQQHAADADWRTVKFMVFDLPASNQPFDRRLQRLRELFAAGQPPHLQLIEQFKVADADELQRSLDQVLAAGGEGLMLHHTQARYHSGRVKHLLKLKTFQDAEARVIGHLPGKGKYRGMLGALLVQSADGRQFRLGSGLSDAQRRTPPPIGTQVSYKYYGLTRTGLPRFASFLRVRDEEPAHTAAQQRPADKANRTK